jgi:macrolide-specific efflux system membrane fusion protein
LKKRKKIILSLMAVLVLGAGGFYLWSSSARKTQEQTQAQQVVRVTRGNIEEVVTAQGKLEPKEYVNVGAQVSGQIQKLFVDIGDTVKIGDQIAIIDPDVYEAQLAGDEARMKTLLAQKTEQESLLEQARRNLARNEKLVRQKAISQEVADDSKTAVAIAESKIKSLSAQIEEQESALEKDRTNLSYTKIFSPMAGTVVTLETREGETLNANQTTPTIVQIANLDIMTVKAQVAEADINKIEEGQPVYFTTLGGQQRRWNTAVRQILPTPEVINDVVLYNVLADIENKDRLLRSNMSTQMFFVRGKADNVLTIPASALTRRMAKHDNEQGQAYEVKVKRGRNVENVIIHVGLSDRTSAEVKAGLKEGDEIILSAAAAGPAAGAPGGQARGGMRGMPRL